MIFTISSYSQIPPIVEVIEFEVKDQPKAFNLMNTWKELEKTMVENAPRIFILSEMDGNTIYFCRAFNSMEESIKYRQSRWGDDGWNSKVYTKWSEAVGENPWDGTDVDIVMEHVYRMRMDLSYMPEGTNLSEELPKNPYRRHVNIAVDWGKGGRRGRRPRTLRGSPPSGSECRLRTAFEARRVSLTAKLLTCQRQVDSSTSCGHHFKL